MLHYSLVLFAIVTGMIGRDRPLPPAWSPDHQILATTEVPQDFVTPEGGNYKVLLNGQLVYPTKAKRFFADFYAGWHTILSDFQWSPDSQHVAFIEKIYDWQYSDPFGQYLDGRVSNEHFFLAIVSRDGKASGYDLKDVPRDLQLEWQNSNAIMLNNNTFDLRVNPPRPIR